MKGIREIIERMQVLLVLHDRVIWENAFSEGRLHTMKERIHQQQIENDWINRNNLDRLMNQNDRNFLQAPIEKIDRQLCSERSFEIEAIQPLLWCCGLTDELAPADQFVVHDFHPLLIGTSLDELCATASIRGKREITKKRDLCMLWNWRCRIGASLNSEKGDLLSSEIRKAFGTKAFISARLLSVPKTDFLVCGTPFSKISEEQRIMLERASRWRYHAYEWVLNDESWYDTSTDT